MPLLLAPLGTPLSNLFDAFRSYHSFAPSMQGGNGGAGGYPPYPPWEAYGAEGGNTKAANAVAGAKEAKVRGTLQGFYKL